MYVKKRSGLGIVMDLGIGIAIVCGTEEPLFRKDMVATAV